MDKKTRNIVILFYKDGDAVISLAKRDGDAYDSYTTHLQEHGGTVRRMLNSMAYNPLYWARWSIPAENAEGIICTLAISLRAEDNVQ